MTNAFFSWRTTKNADGTYSFTVAKNTSTTDPLPSGRYCITETVKSQGGFSSRAKAKARAQKWQRYLRASN